MTGQRNRTKSLGAVLGHLFLPELIRKFQAIILRPSMRRRREMKRIGVD
jgi:hypothetical protein